MYIPELENILKENSLDSYINPRNLRLFDQLCSLVAEENKSLNLTSITDPNMMGLLHIADSLTAARLIPSGVRVMDVGTGAGFPALPLAIARSDIQITCMDATAKKIDFVQKTVDALKLDNVTCISGRAEQLAGWSKNTPQEAVPGAEYAIHREKYDIAVSRAVANLPVLCELCLPFVKNDGIFLALKGEKADEECNSSGNALRLLGNCEFYKETVILSYAGVSYGRNIVVAKKKETIEKKYPRAFAKIIKKPL